MSLELGIIIGLTVPAAVLAYIGFQLKDKHSSIKLVMVSVAQIFLIGLPFTAWRFASLNGYPAIAQYTLYFNLALVVVFILFVFYSVWLYIKAAALVTSGTKDRFQQDELPGG